MRRKMSHSLAPSVRAASMTSSEIPLRAAEDDHREPGRRPDVSPDQRVVDEVLAPYAAASPPKSVISAFREPMSGSGS